MTRYTIEIIRNRMNTHTNCLENQKLCVHSWPRLKDVFGHEFRSKKQFLAPINKQQFEFPFSGILRQQQQSRNADKFCHAAEDVYFATIEYQLIIRLEHSILKDST